MNKIPFSAYDFFGYLGTGFLILAATDIVFEWGWIKSNSIPTGILFLSLIFAYVIGHIIAHLSSFFLEILFLRKVLLSPEIHLFKKSHSKWRYIFPNNFKNLPQQTQDRILSKAESGGITDVGRALFIHCHSIVKHEPIIYERLSTFLNLYGFSRNMSLTFIIAAIILIYGSLYIWAFVCFSIGYGMLARYIKFFRHYTIEVFVSYAELKNKE